MGDEGGSTSIAKLKQMKAMQLQQQEIEKKVRYEDQENFEELEKPLKPVIKEKSSNNLKSVKIKEVFSEVKAGKYYKVKEAAIVVVIFLILNSKIFWSQLMKIPGMGMIEPSIFALISNAILSGVIFYLITKFILKENNEN